MKTDKAGFQNRIEDFISAQVTGRGLDDRTEKAYRQDLEHFYLWMEEHSLSEAIGDRDENWETELKKYLDYLSGEKNLRPSTIIRKQKVFTYYLAYLVRQGVLPACRPLTLISSGASDEKTRQQKGKRETGSGGVLSKQEVDDLFRTLNREYENLDSQFRKRVCLRDLVMLKLLFFHKIEISQLLLLKVSDYDLKTGTLTLRSKRGKEVSVYVFSKTLREQMERWLWERIYFERPNGFEDCMFLSKLGKPLSMKMVINVADKYRRMAGIEKEITPKDLKKSMEQYAKELVMEWCG